MINGTTFYQDFVTRGQWLLEIQSGAQPCLLSADGEEFNVHIEHCVTLNVPESLNSVNAFKEKVDFKDWKRLCLLLDMKLPDVTLAPVPLANYTPLKLKISELIMKV